MNNKVNGNDLLALGFEEGKSLGLALKLASFQEGVTREELLEWLKKIKKNPENFLDDEKAEELATSLIEEASRPEDDTIAIKDQGDCYAVYGAQYIEEGARLQMDVAMRLPVTAAGALMPDAHQGYGLPIGGVLATRNAVIPYGVGVDIGCRMALSVFDIPESHFLENAAMYKRELIAHTAFGAGAGFRGQYKADHEVLDSDVFDMTPMIRQLKDKAASQLGSSGGGNHFVEWGILELAERDEQLNMDKGRYVALLSHSGSRGFGATIAGHYTRLARQLCKLPKEAANLAWLDLDTAEGQEYWLAMNLAGDYASACHEVIHQRLTEAIGGQLLARVENHHNFAWKESFNGEEVIVHRKGATPAGKGVPGIIPGSMTAPGFLVRGKGEHSSIQSASHGAGRRMSRTKAMQNITPQEMRTLLKEHGVTLIGGGLDEAPIAYKDIRVVMAAQKELVDIIATFSPRMVRMADDGSRED